MDKIKIRDNIIKPLREEIQLLFNQIQNKDKISDIEDILKYYLHFHSFLMDGDTQTAGYLKGVTKVTESLKEFIHPSRKDSQNVLFNKPYNRLILIYVKIVTILIYLYKKGYLPELGRNPASFIGEIINKIIIDKDETSQQLIDEILHDELKAIKPEFWEAILRKAYIEIKILYWSDFDFNRESDFSLSKILEKMKGDLHENNYDLLTDEISDVDYIDYFKKVSVKFQSDFDQPDIIFIDSSYIADFKSKGAIVSIDSILKKTDYEQIINSIDKISLLSLGKTVNGTLDAIPFTRNFHVPGILQSAYDKIIDNETDNKFKTDYIAEFIKLIKLENPDQAKINYNILLTIINNRKDDGNGLEKILQNQLYDKSTGQEDEKITLRFYSSLFKDLGQEDILKDKDKDEITKGSVTIINMGINEDEDEVADYYIPMQLAKGAHVTYTVFAYLANSSQQQISMISSQNDEESEKERKEPKNERKNHYDFKVTSKNDLKKNTTDFYKLIFKYVPVISLSLDQKASGILRDKQIKWFDLCLPIESQKYQSENILFSKAPVYRYVDKPLSCIGGFVLAVNKHSKDYAGATKIIKELLKYYYWYKGSKKNNNKKEQKEQNHEIVHDIECRIKTESPEEESALQKNCFTDTYNEIKIPNNIAKRPNSDYWKSIEEIISYVFRIHIITLFIYRHFKILNNGEKDPNKMQILPKDIKPDLIENTINRFKEIAQVGFIQSFDEDLLEQKKTYISSLPDWFTLNFSFPANDVIYIKEIISIYMEKSIDDFMNVLSDKTIDLLFEKIENCMLENNLKMI
ncbi:MAG: hypothetical protein K8R68_11590 [Bacteroidales bacterium]|nr:hypothetical protein [Bacteroidales bacterium]